MQRVSTVTVRIPTPLRSLTKGTAEVQAKGDTVDDLVLDLERQFPGIVTTTGSGDWFLFYDPA